MSNVEVAYRYAAPPARPIALPGDAGFKIDEGAPDGRLFPVELLARAYRSATLQTAEANGFQYRDPRGSPALREGIASMLRGQRGLPVTAENICITRGSQNGLFLAAQILLRPGDAVVVEALTYEPAVAAFRALGAQIVPVSLDDGGIDIDAVEQACRRHAVRAVFVTPHHQFPTTVSLRPGRRLRLVELARRLGFAILEDDYDHEFHFQSQPLRPLASYGAGQVIYVGSLSKLLLPALRIGYIAAPPSVIDAIAHRVSLTDGMGNALTEDATAALIANGDADDIAQDVCCILAERLGDFRGEAKFTTWLCSIVFNACRDFRRRRSAFQRFAGKLSVMAGLTDGPDGRDLYDAIWIESAISRLKPDLRDAAILVAGQQLTHGEAAQILGIAEATVSWRMHEVRRQLAPKAGTED